MLIVIRGVQGRYNQNFPWEIFYDSREEYIISAWPPPLQPHPNPTPAGKFLGILGIFVKNFGFLREILRICHIVNVSAMKIKNIDLKPFLCRLLYYFSWCLILKKFIISKEWIELIKLM